MKLSVVIINYKSYEKTFKCLNSLNTEINAIDQIIIIDNDSNNNSLEYIQNFLYSKGITPIRYSNKRLNLNNKYLLYQNNLNCGYACGNNIGISIAEKFGSDLLLILNNDIIVQEGSIGELVTFISRHPEVACVGPIIQKGNSYDINFARKRLLWYDFFLLSGIGKRLFKSKYWLKHHYISYSSLPNDPFPVDMISGSCMLFRMESLKTIGGFDENTFLFYEEAIVSENLRNFNLKTYIVPSSIVYHEHAGTIKNEKKSIILKYSLKSQYYYLHKVRKYNAFATKLIMSGQYFSYFITYFIEKCRL